MSVKCIDGTLIHRCFRMDDDHKFVIAFISPMALRNRRYVPYSSHADTVQFLRALVCSVVQFTSFSFFKIFTEIM